MKFITHPFRHSNTILNEPEFIDEYHSLLNTLSSITDKELIDTFNEYHSGSKSISKSINTVIKEKLVNLDWKAEAFIFHDPKYRGGRDKTWRLDFAKKDISVEVAFNNGGSIAWNLIKPVLASELNHVKKDIQTKIGVIICATDKMKIAGGFDSAVGSYEDFISYLNPFQNILSIPILFIGLEPFETFKIKHTKVGTNYIGSIEMIN